MPMKTSDLIALLSETNEPVQPAAILPQLVLVSIASILGLCLLAWGVLGVRPDIGAATDYVVFKMALSAVAALAALALLTTLARPTGTPKRWPLLVGAYLLIAIGATVITLSSAPSEARMTLWINNGFPQCLVAIPALALPVSVGIILTMRRFAPIQLPLTGGAVGLLAGGIGGVAYALICSADSVAYVSTWYVAAFGICAGLGACAHRLLRW